MVFDLFWFSSFFYFLVCHIALPYTQFTYYDFKDSELISTDNSSNLISLKRDERVDNIEMHDKPLSSSSHKTPSSLPLPSTSYPMLSKAASKNSLSSSLQNFASRNIKHHTFDNQGFQDVKHMEKNLISLLDDFHNGK